MISPSLAWQLRTYVWEVTKNLSKISIYTDHLNDYTYLKRIVSFWEFEEMNFYSSMECQPKYKAS